jgi:hypothetical protein
MTHTGFNQEDSVMINQSALDRGLFTSTYYKAFRDQCTKNHSTGEEEVFSNPTGSASLKPFSYEKLDETGFVPKNTFVNGDDILIGKVMPKKINEIFGVSEDDLTKEGVFNGFIDLDSVFYVDPHLLQNTKIPELENSYLHFKKHFSKIHLSTIHFWKIIFYGKIVLLNCPERMNGSNSFTNFIY